MPEQGERARQTLAEGGAVEAIAAAISRLSLHAPLPGGDDEDSQPQGRLSIKVRAVATSETRGSSGWIRFMEVISRRPAPHCEVGLLLESGLRKVSYRTTQSATVRSSAQTEAMGAEGAAPHFMEVCAPRRRLGELRGRRSKSYKSFCDVARVTATLAV